MQRSIQPLRSTVTAGCSTPVFGETMMNPSGFYVCTSTIWPGLHIPNRCPPASRRHRFRLIPRPHAASSVKLVIAVLLFWRRTWLGRSRDVPVYATFSHSGGRTPSKPSAQTRSLPWQYLLNMISHTYTKCISCKIVYHIVQEVSLCSVQRPPV